jgi:hypothetical protein
MMAMLAILRETEFDNVGNPGADAVRRIRLANFKALTIELLCQMEENCDIIESYERNFPCQWHAETKYAEVNMKADKTG